MAEIDLDELDNSMMTENRNNKNRNRNVLNELEIKIKNGKSIKWKNNIMHENWKWLFK